MSMKPLYIALDTETTGLDPAANSIIELAAVALDDQLRPRDEEDTFQTLVRPLPHLKIEPQALKVNGHYWCRDTTSETYNKALPYQEAWNSFMEYMARHFGKNPKWIIMIGWNPSFDEAFLREMHRNVSDGAWPFHYHKLDYLSICRYLDIRAGRTRRTYKLASVARQCLSEEEMAGLVEHTALADTLLAIKTLEAVEKDDQRRTPPQ